MKVSLLTRFFPVLFLIVLISAHPAFAASTSGRNLLKAESQSIQQSMGTEKIVVGSADALPTRFQGFGAEWDPRDYNANGITENDYGVITSRIKWMKMPIVRMMMVANYVYLGSGKYNWESDSMKLLYRNLDYCQKNGISVILADWGAEQDVSWLKAPGVKGVSDPVYAKVIATYMDYLVNKRGYSCIKFFTLNNEPDLFIKDFAKWKSGVENVWHELVASGLQNKVRLLGPDTTSGKSPEWVINTFNQLSNIITSYDVHGYVQRDTIKSGQFEQKLISDYGSVLANKSLGKYPFIIAEAGMNDDAKHPIGNPHIGDYDYGVFMADYAVQAVRAGSSSVLAWMLDDNSHKDFYWGLWSDKSHGLEIRPWFYTWSLLTRYFPGGSIMYKVQQPSGMRILAARIPGSTGTNDNWTVCLINREDRSRNMEITLPNAGITETKRFVYSQDQAKKDIYGYPAPVAVEKLSLGKSANVVCPPNSVTVLTSALP